MLRTWRAFVTLDVLDMILQRDPSYRMEKLAEEIVEQTEELNHLKSELNRLKQRYPDAVPEEDLGDAKEADLLVSKSIAAKPIES